MMRPKFPPALSRIAPLLALAVALLLLTAAACGAPAATPTVAPPTPTAMPQPTATPAPTAAPTAARPGATAAPTATALPYIKDEPGAAEPLALNVIMATTLLETGRQRVAFLLTTPTGLVKGDNRVAITPVRLPGGAAGDAVAAQFRQWPYGVRGAFTAEMEFDRPGLWRLDIAAQGPDAGAASMEIEILPDSTVPFIGSAAPPSDNKTLAAVGAIELLTTDYSPDPALYQTTIREAIASPLPAVVVFASPAFCTTATCGPQVDAVSELRETYAGQAHFIHVEIYDNPDEIQGDLDRARIAPPVAEWGLTGIPHWFNESWTFVLDAAGRVQSRFEGFATTEELETALKSALN